MRILFLIAFISISFNGLSQSVKSSKLPNSLISLDANWSFIGGPIIDSKLLVGSKNTGVLIGYQFGGFGYNLDTSGSYNWVDKRKSLRLGYQLGFGNGFYSSLSLDLCSSRHEYNVYEYDPFWGYNYLYTDYNTKRGLRLNLGAGYTINFLKSKRLYLNVQSVFHLIDRSNLGNLNIGSRIQLVTGIGYRLGTPSTTTYEGVKNVTTVPIKP